jgi:hypothetical protein
MNKKSYFQYCYSLGLCSLLFCAPLHADENFDFELDFKQERITLDDQTRIETNSFGINYTEYNGWPLVLQFSLGQDGNIEHQKDASVTSYSPDGYYAGLGARLSTSEQNRLQASLDISYTYHEGTDDSNDPDILEMRWHQAEARLWLSARVTNRLALYGCALALDLKGKQKVKGSAPAEIDLKNDQRNGYCGGIKYIMPDNGYVGLEGNGGAIQGGRIYFGKRFN